MSDYPTPLVNLRVKIKKNNFNKLATLCALPDTGASINCVEEKFVKKHNLEILIDTNQMIELVSTEGKMIKVLGTTQLKIQAPGGGWTTTVALVCPELSNQFLLTWITQKRLQLLHQGWPFTRIMSENLATLSEIQITPKRLRPWEQNPDPKSPEWPRPEWPQEFKDLCREFEDVLVDKSEYAQNIT